MMVSVQFCGVQRALTRTHEIEVPLGEKGRVRDVFAYLVECYPGLPLNNNSIFVTVNNKISTIDQPLRPNDTITFLPHIGGG
jgi:molybdopterin converting factor small subunit